jgi:hypothetical protein
MTPMQLSSAVPPPAMPSSTGARVACGAASTRACLFFISESVAAPTLIRATPPASSARRLGDAVVIGRRTSLAEWQEAREEAPKQPEHWSAQSALTDVEQGRGG